MPRGQTVIATISCFDEVRAELQRRGPSPDIILFDPVRGAAGVALKALLECDACREQFGKKKFWDRSENRETALQFK